ncbi:MAG: hypothetical protein GY778_01305, partial [bacterium]|nr:hypothetical protein [bacterium]
GDFDDRVALDDSAFDGNFETAPYVERHGEEFHLALLGGEFSWGDVIEVSGDGDTVFDAGEVWHIRAAWFHRAHGFEPFSFMQGGAVAGEYAPVSDLQFRHDPTADLTTISLVFPLTNVGAGLMSGQPPEPLNFDPSDQASVLEGLADLVISAQFFPPPHQDPEEALIYEWYDENATDFLEPGDWRVTALLGSSYTAPDPAGVYFVWSDAYPDAIRGDVDGSGEISDDDKVALAGYIAAQDGSDGTVDGVVTLLDFAADFSVFDLNHDGLVDPVDLMLVSARGDCDDDGDVDLADYQKLQVCFTGDGGAFVPGPCSLADLDADNDVDRGDFEWFANVLTGAED